MSCVERVRPARNLPMVLSLCRNYKRSCRYSQSWEYVQSGSYPRSVSYTSTGLPKSAHVRVHTYEYIRLRRFPGLRNRSHREMNSLFQQGRQFDPLAQPKFNYEKQRLGMQFKVRDANCVLCYPTQHYTCACSSACSGRGITGGWVPHISGARAGRYSIVLGCHCMIPVHTGIACRCFDHTFALSIQGTRFVCPCMECDVGTSQSTASFV